MARPLHLLGCFAHPDDETWMLGGSLALLVPKGVRCAVWTATRGQAGEIAEGTGATRETLPAVREREERAAMAVLGVGEVELDGFVDGECERDLDGLTRAVAALLDRRQPDVVVTMEPRGVTEHADHVAVSAATVAAFAAYAEGHRAAGGPEPRLYHGGLPAARLRLYRELAAEAGVEMPAEGEPFAPRGTPDELFTCTVDTAAVAELKLRALMEHKTQASEYTMLLGREAAWRQVLGEEAFIRVHPTPRPGDPHEASLIDGLGGVDHG